MNKQSKLSQDVKVIDKLIFVNTLVTHKKDSFFHKVYYYLIEFPLFYSYKNFLKYTVLGICGTIADFGLTFVFTDIVGIFYLISSAMAYMVGITISYLLDQKYVYKYKFVKFSDLVNDYFSYVLIMLSSLVIILILMTVFVELLGMGYMLAKVIASLSVLIYKYVAHTTVLKTES